MPNSIPSKILLQNFSPLCAESLKLSHATLSSYLRIPAVLLSSISKKLNELIELLETVKSLTSPQKMMKQSKSDECERWRQTFAKKSCQKIFAGLSSKGLYSQTTDWKWKWRWTLLKRFHTAAVQSCLNSFLSSDNF